MSYRRIMPEPARGHMPFEGHRTCQEVRQDKERAEILRTLGEGPCIRCGVRHSIGCAHVRKLVA